MQEKSHFGPIFCLVDARVASYSLGHPKTPRALSGTPLDNGHRKAQGVI